jgi:hypothetical protein
MSTPSPTTTANRFAEAAHAVITARDFCGDERQALRDWQDDNGRLTSDERLQVLDLVETIWADSQRQAGVRRPIAAGERRGIEAALEANDQEVER